MYSQNALICKKHKCTMGEINKYGMDRCHLKQNMKMVQPFLLQFLQIFIDLSLVVSVTPRHIVCFSFICHPAALCNAVYGVKVVCLFFVGFFLPSSSQRCINIKGQDSRVLAILQDCCKTLKQGSCLFLKYHNLIYQRSL